jgi:DNA-binding XRE family transcriptional regulator
MNNRLTRRRESLYSTEEVAKELGVSREEIEKLEDGFLSRIQKNYLKLLNYEIGFYPHRKKRQKKIANGEVVIDGRC